MRGRAADSTTTRQRGERSAVYEWKWGSGIAEGVWQKRDTEAPECVNRIGEIGRLSLVNSCSYIGTGIVGSPVVLYLKQLSAEIA